MRKKLPAILTLLGAFFAVGMVLATDLVDPDAEGVSAPYLIAGSRVTPSYPPAAYAAKYAGTVNLRATVNADGTVGSIEILDSSARNMGFEDAALDAVSRWRFEPARQGDSAVDSFTEIRLSFNPPSNRSRGYVASGFGAPTASSGATTMASLPTKVSASAVSPTDVRRGIRTAWLPVQLPWCEKYGKPHGPIGSAYFVSDLIPPGTGGKDLTPR